MGKLEEFTRRKLREYNATPDEWDGFECAMMEDEHKKSGLLEAMERLMSLIYDKNLEGDDEIREELENSRQAVKEARDG